MKQIVKKFNLSLTCLMLTTISTNVVKGQEIENETINDQPISDVIYENRIGKEIYINIDNCIVDKESYEFIKKVFMAANSLVGQSGDCFEIIKRFVSLVYGDDHDLAKMIIVDDPLPGDILYYRNGGLGIEHWGVYVDENHALQGNFNGQAVMLDSVILFGNSPIYYRVV